MTTNDTTYFLSNPHQWEHPLVKDRWMYTCKFLANNSYPIKRNYSDEEITNHLENELSDITSHGCGQTVHTIAESGTECKNRLVSADKLVTI